MCLKGHPTARMAKTLSLGDSNRASDGRFKRVHLVERLG
jgi:hypothetical protein